jgi:hypothetical protein
MHDAPYFSISTLPKSAKRAITNRLITARVSQKNKQEFVNIMDFMNNGPDGDGKLLREKIRELDNRRNEDLTKVEPEFSYIINYNGS